MHQSWLKNHMCVFGWIYRSHARNGNEIQTSGHRGSDENIEKLGFKILVNPKHSWKSWNLAWCHVMVLPCCGKKIWQNRNKFLYKLLANWSFSQEGSWFRERTCHLRVQNDIHTLPSPALICLHRQIRPNRSIVLNFGIIPGSFGLFYTLTEFCGILYA